MPEESEFRVADLCEAAASGDSEKVREILDAQPGLVNVKVAESDEHSALHFAVKNERADVVRLLMDAGADHTAGIYPHRDATNALTLAADRGYEQIVRIMRDEDEKRTLAACSNISISPENEELFEAVKAGDVVKVSVLIKLYPLLIDACHREGGSVLHKAASCGQYKIVQTLLANKANIAHLTAEGQSPLDGAVLNAHKAGASEVSGFHICTGLLLQTGCSVSLESAIALGDSDLVENYIKQAPDRFVSNDSDRDGLLQIAVRHDRHETVRLLLDAGLHPDDRHQLAEYESKPFSWGEPLVLAAGNGKYSIASLLLERGADANASIYGSQSPVGAAYNNCDDEMKGLLFQYGGVLDHTFAGLEGETSAAAVMLKHNPSIASDLLWSACCGGDRHIVGLCLREMDWGPEDDRWFSILEQPLRLWRTNPHRKFRDFDCSVYLRIFRLILDEGVSPNLIGRFGYRIAHRLAACGVVWGEQIMKEAERVEFARVLLSYGAELDVLDDLLLSSPLGWAVRWGKLDLARLYLDSGADPGLAGAEWATPISWAEKRGDGDMVALIRKYVG